MNPKEKAKELYNKHSYIIKGLLNYPNGTTKYKAKQCAIICVDEILENNLIVLSGGVYQRELNYWQEVKEEIEKL